MKLGLALPHYDQGFPDAGPANFERVAGYAERAEAIGLSQLWVSDHFWLNLDRYGGPPARRGSLECWTTLSALAVRTRRVRLGSLVMAVGFRSPTLLAKMAATLDQLMGGRLDLGLGACWTPCSPAARLRSPTADAITTRTTRRSSPVRCSGPALRCGSAAAATACWAWWHGPRTAGTSAGRSRRSGTTSA